MRRRGVLGFAVWSFFALVFRGFRVDAYRAPSRVHEAVSLWAGVILQYDECWWAGTDATDAFDDIGHSNGAKKQLVEKCECKGELVGAPEKKKRGSSGGGGGGEGGVGIAGILVPVVVMAVLAFLVQKFV